MTKIAINCLGLLLKDVQAIGTDAVITASKDAIAKATEIPKILNILDHNNILKGTRILTIDGRDLGVMIDLYFDERTGEVEGYEVSGGLFADAYSGRSFVPAIQTLKIGRDVVFVPIQTAQLMEEQVGGMRAAMQTVSDKVQETAQVTGDKIQDFGRSATTSIANSIIDPEEQKAFVVGRTAEHEVLAPDGQSFVLRGQTVTEAIANSAVYLGILEQLYRATGGRFSDKLGQQVGNAVAGLTVDQTQGRRVQQVVSTDGGSIIAAPGQIVTARVIERAKTYHQEQALLQAVGLSTGEAARDSTSNVMTRAGYQIKSTTRHTGEQIQAGAKGLWTQVKETASEIQARGTQAIEEQRIKGSLGRAVNRVILDQRDQVILNVGELITHQAIAAARQSQVLDLLLNSVYNEKPKLSLEDLRAPQAGRAAL
ncbi:PRC-barrel domain-containing protein [Crocosphaera sp. XPORK-15E]|uniref:PRC-barrel domain-containing protein n=1 Tax=Crocosphaera sp. XPORK-15E TaxID=3110247 RepID=UPI002B1F18E2|nr:PRC-barrel domain-containing protein [Crocosphaera sp. XPORK-15E]MEA5534646.1 PRC-barrel domain-containing protein [Crocosphaera sp. XPORK-15E]